MKENTKNAIESLKDNGFHTYYFDTSKEAVDAIVKDIDKDKTIGIGGSVTIDEIGLYEKLLEEGVTTYWHQKADANEKDVVLNKASNANVYISGTNAITENGEIVNIDGRGNRVSHLFYGHEKIIIVVGINKITKDYNEAIDRIKNVACPKNAERLNLDVPCRYTGKCTNCSSPQRMCRITNILEKQPMGGNIHIYIINEVLGY